jgi:hypothetical protein
MTQTNDPVDDNLAEEQQDPTQQINDEQNIETEKAEEPDDSLQVDHKEKAAQSFKEAMRLKKEKEALASENLYYKNVADFAKDTSKIHDIAKSNPEMADRIVKEFGYGETYAEAISKETKGETSTTDQVVDPKQAAREVYLEQEQAKEKSAIDDFEVQFFIDNGISMNSAKYKAIMNTYSRFPKKTLKDAKDLLTMAHMKHVPNVEVEVPSPNGDFGSRGKIKSEFTDEDRKIMQENGWDAAKMREFKATPMASWGN